MVAIIIIVSPLSSSLIIIQSNLPIISVIYMTNTFRKIPEQINGSMNECILQGSHICGVILQVKNHLETSLLKLFEYLLTAKRNKENVENHSNTRKLHHGYSINLTKSLIYTLMSRFLC